MPAEHDHLVGPLAPAQFGHHVAGLHVRQRARLHAQPHHDALAALLQPSQQLRVLEEAGLVNARKDGTRRLYSVNAKALAEVRDYFDKFWDHALAGKSGVKPLEQEWAADQAVRIAAPVAVEPTEVIPRPQARRLDRSAQFALVAAKEAWADAGFEAKAGEDPNIDPDRLGALWPMMNTEDVALAAYEPRGGFADATQLALHFGQVARQQGARLRQHTPVARILTEGDKATGVELESGEVVEADLGVVAAGWWSKKLLAGLGIDFPVEAYRSELLSVDAGELIYWCPDYALSRMFRPTGDFLERKRVTLVPDGLQPRRLTFFDHGAAVVVERDAKRFGKGLEELCMLGGELAAGQSDEHERGDL